MSSANDAIDNMTKALSLGMTHEQRLACSDARYDLRELLREWRATTDDVKRAIIQDAIAALDHVPLPDDLASEEETLDELGERIDALSGRGEQPTSEPQSEEPAHSAQAVAVSNERCTSKEDGNG